MTNHPKDQEREERIVMEIVVDAYDPEERAMAGTTICKGSFSFPFSRTASPGVPFRRCGLATKSRSSIWHRKKNASTKCSS